MLNASLPEVINDTFQEEDQEPTIPLKSELVYFCNTKY